MPGTNRAITVLIVDDEKEACANLKNILTEYIDDKVDIIGTAFNTKEAEKLIAKYAPEAIFLDIEMPNENAFHFLERISPVNFEVIFVTAYDEYAIRAFKLNAVDYILKPISIPELKQAIIRLKEKIKFKKVLNDTRNNSFYDDISGQVINKAKSHRITLKDNNVIEVVDFKDIFFIEALGSYFRVIFAKENSIREIIMCGTLTDYEELLPPDQFFRIHKSYIINCLHVKKILRDDYNHVQIKDNYKLPISRRRYAPLLEFLKNNHYYNE